MSTTTTNVTHPDGTTVTTTTTEAGPSPPTGLQLYYWNGRGLMEVARMILAAAGLKAGADYADIRITTDIDPATGQQLKDGEPVVDAGGKPVMYDKGDKDVRAMSTLGAKGEPGLLDINLGRMPIVVTSQGSIGQRSAINAYLADSFGLNGDSSFDRAKIVAIDEALGEMMTAWGKLMPDKDGATDEEKAANAAEKIKTWFAESASTDYCGPSDMKNRQRYAMWYLKRLETICGDTFAVGGKLSLADLLIYNKLAEVLTDAEIPRPDFPASRRYPFGNKEATEAALQDYPKISAIIASVKADPVRAPLLLLLLLRSAAVIMISQLPCLPHADY
eukprot:COSAG05_NODE_3697_length_1898_cov_2.719288_1_plen_333_part_00